DGPDDARPATTAGSRIVEGWDFPMPEELVEDLFELGPQGQGREAVIPMDVKMPDGLVYKVQIGAFRNPVPQELFSDMSPVMGESAGNGLVRYTAGLFTGFGSADQAKEQVRGRGYRDAFVVAYLDGRRISLAEARTLG
ncbi:MAG: SPOR domain-containing protein, partial [Flavobacteriales bacterium]|nr:SPOR domain-containing protein [Flavobacteriales bacterium]